MEPASTWTEAMFQVPVAFEGARNANETPSSPFVPSVFPVIEGKNVVHVKYCHDVESVYVGEFAG
jgi:hypothetical protein